MRQHALVIGIDGLRHDHVSAELTPCLCDLGAAGFLTVAEHAILGNDLTGHTAGAGTAYQVAASAADRTPGS